MARVAGKRKLRRRQGRRLVRACSRALTKASIASAKPAPSATLTLAKALDTVTPVLGHPQADRTLEDAQKPPGGDNYTAPQAANIIKWWKNRE